MTDTWGSSKREAYPPSICQAHTNAVALLVAVVATQHCKFSSPVFNLQCCAGQISLDALGAAFVFFFGFTSYIM